LGEKRNGKRREEKNKDASERQRGDREEMVGESNIFQEEWKKKK
jgi:hypothetical protein